VPLYATYQYEIKCPSNYYMTCVVHSSISTVSTGSLVFMKIAMLSENIPSCIHQNARSVNQNHYSHSHTTVLSTLSTTAYVERGGVDRV